MRARRDRYMYVDFKTSAALKLSKQFFDILQIAHRYTSNDRTTSKCDSSVSYTKKKTSTHWDKKTSQKKGTSYYLPRHIRIHIYIHTRDIRCGGNSVHGSLLASGSHYFRCSGAGHKKRRSLALLSNAVHRRCCIYTYIYVQTSECGSI